MFAKRMATVAGMAAFAAVVAAVPATADINSYATGSHAYSFGTQTRVAVKDTAADARHVYTNYYRSGLTASSRLNNVGGVGSTATSAAGNTVTSLRACTEIDLAPDSCDAFRS